MARPVSQSRLSSRSFGRALLFFDGSSDYMTLPITPGTNGMSFAFWLWMVDLVDASFGRVFDYWASNKGVRCYINGARGGLDFDIGNGTSTYSAQYPVSFGYTSAWINSWNHFVITMDSSGVRNLYLNGYNIVHNSGGANYAVPVAQTFTMGKESAASSSFAFFTIDEFMFKNGTPFTQTEVNNLYTKGILPNNLTCHLNFNDQVIDQTGNGNNGTRHGTAYTDNAPII